LVRTKKSVRYQSVSLSVPFVDLIKERIANDPKYRSVADFVRDAVRDRLEVDLAIRNNPLPIQQQIIEQFVNKKYNEEYAENPEVDAFLEEHGDKLEQEYQRLQKVIQRESNTIFKKAIDRILREEEKQKKKKENNGVRY